MCPTTISNLARMSNKFIIIIWPTFTDSHSVKYHFNASIFIFFNYLRCKLPLPESIDKNMCPNMIRWPTRRQSPLVKSLTKLPTIQFRITFGMNLESNHISQLQLQDLLQTQSLESWCLLYWKFLAPKWHLKDFAPNVCFGNQDKFIIFEERDQNFEFAKLLDLRIICFFSNVLSGEDKPKTKTESQNKHFYTKTKKKI